MQSPVTHPARMVVNALLPTNASVQMVGKETSVNKVYTDRTKLASQLTCAILLLYSLKAHCSSPCENGGNCTVGDVCICAQGWQGKRCNQGNEQLKFY